VNVLLDEQLDAAVADGLNLMTHRHGMRVESMRRVAPGTKDQQIPALCRESGHSALISANVRDFGARKPLYEALLEAGVSVVVLRPGRGQVLTPEVQLGVLSQHSSAIGRMLSAAEAPVLLRVRQSGVVERTLDELRGEFEGTEQLP
jgi:hypothetical protein